MFQRLRAVMAVVSFGAFAGLACLAAAAPQTWTGKITDSMCRTDHAGRGGTPDKERACMLDCVKNMGAQFILVVDKKIYKIGNQKFADLTAHAGQTVQLTGELKGDTITVSKIEEVKEPR